MANNCIITLDTDMNFKVSVSGRMLYNIFSLFSLKKVGLCRVCARFIVMSKSFFRRNVCSKTVLQFGQNRQELLQMKWKIRCQMHEGLII